MAVYIFDIDGTLTEPRNKMSNNFIDIFKHWIDGKKVYLITGSDYRKAEEQIPKNILKNVTGVYCCMGNELYVEGKQRHNVFFEFPEPLMADLEEIITKSKYKPKTGNHIEIRNGMINVSTVGRNATNNQRIAYTKWDDKYKERDLIIEKLRKTWSKEFDISKGGQISIDINPFGLNKGQIHKKLREKYFYTEKFIFVGDRTIEPGNDFPLAEQLYKECLVLGQNVNKVYQVAGPDETLILIKNEFE